MLFTKFVSQLRYDISNLLLHILNIYDIIINLLIVVEITDKLYAFTEVYTLKSKDKLTDIFY